MNKLYTTISLCGLIIFLLFCAVTLRSQNTPSLKDIKRTGKYFSGDSDGYDTLKVKEAARTNLMSNISKQIKDVNSFNGKSEIMVKYIQYIVKPLGEDGYIKVVAYVPVENVTRIIENKEPLVVTEIKYTESKAPPKKEEITDKPIVVPNENAETQINKTDIKKDIVPSAPNTLLERLIACNTSVELGKLLQKEKSNNALMYSTSEVFRKINSPENFYIVLFDGETTEIISFFDKGNAERKDLRSGKISMNIENDSKNLVQVWIQLF